MSWIILIIAGCFESCFAFCLGKMKGKGVFGISAVGTVLLGIIFFHEPASFWRLFFIVTLIISIIGLKMLG